jgi:hypothetical protein
MCLIFRWLIISDLNGTLGGAPFGFDTGDVRLVEAGACRGLAGGDDRGRDDPRACWALAEPRQLFYFYPA